MHVVEGNSCCFPWRAGQGSHRPYWYCFREGSKRDSDLVMMLSENGCTFRSCVYLGSGVKCFQRVCTRYCMFQCGLLESVFRCAIAEAQGGSFAASAKAQQKEGFSFVEFVPGSGSALILFI